MLLADKRTLVSLYDTASGAKAQISEILEEAEDGHGADAAGHRSDSRSDRCDRIEIDVANELAAGDLIFELLAASSIDADVYDDGAVADMSSGDEVRLACGYEQDIGPPSLGSEISGLGMADGDRGVLIEAECGQRLADEHRAADDDGMPAEEVDLVIRQELLHAADGRGQDSVVFPGEPLLHIRGSEAVGILARVDRVDDCVLIERDRERQLSEDAVDLLVAVAFHDAGDEVCLGDALGQMDVTDAHADLGGEG